jgi:hypothetical protein
MNGVWTVKTTAQANKIRPFKNEGRESRLCFIKYFQPLFFVG